MSEVKLDLSQNTFSFWTVWVGIIAHVGVFFQPTCCWGELPSCFGVTCLHVLSLNHNREWGKSLLSLGSPEEDVSIVNFPEFLCGIFLYIHYQGQQPIGQVQRMILLPKEQENLSGILIPQYIPKNIYSDALLNGYKLYKFTFCGQKKYSKQTNNTCVSFILTIAYSRNHLRVLKLNSRKNRKVWYISF